MSDLNINGAYSVPSNNSYISKDSSTQTLSYLSHDSTTLKTKSPDVQPNASILLNLTNIDNPYSSPNGILSKGFLKKSFKTSTIVLLHIFTDFKRCCEGL